MSNYATTGGLIVLGALLPTLGLITTGLRFWTRRLQNAPWLVDDWLLVPAEIILFAMGVALIVGVAGHGEGWKVPAEVDGVATDGNSAGANVEVLTDKIEYIILTIANLQLGCAKLSILFFYRRIFCTSKTSVLNGATTVMIVITTPCGLWHSFSPIFSNVGPDFP